MKLTIDGTEYIHGATHAGLDCWLATVEVEAIESLRTQDLPAYWKPEAPGDFAKDELIRYLAGPDDYQRRDGILITDANDTRKRWPLRNMHRQIDRGGKPEARTIHRAYEGGGTESSRSGQKPSSEPAAKPADTYATRKTDKLPERAEGAEWPKWERNNTPILGVWELCRSDSARGGCMLFGRNGKTITESVSAYQDAASRERGWKPITPTEAAQWLRANGHAAEADRIERAADIFEPVDVQPRKGDKMRHVKDGQTFVAANDGQKSGAGFHSETDEWRTPISTGGHVYTLKDGTGYRILRRTGEPRHPSTGQARVRVFASNYSGAYRAYRDGEPVGWGPHFEWGAAAQVSLDEALCMPRLRELTPAEIADLCAHVPAAAAILNAKG